MEKWNQSIAPSVAGASYNIRTRLKRINSSFMDAKTEVSPMVDLLPPLLFPS